jgi:uncharacterized protein (UPF0548 family)
MTRWRRRRERSALAELADRPLNYAPAALADAGPQIGWHVDDYRQPLPAELPGEPVAGASFEIAQRLMRNYAFADPAIVRAVFDPAGRLADRNMLLQARFGPLRFLLGCRVGAIADETRTVDGRAVRIWGWSYGTLAGHVERGQMDFAVWKWLDDGAVEFRTGGRPGDRIAGRPAPSAARRRLAVPIATSRRGSEARFSLVEGEPKGHACTAEVPR